MSVRRRSVVAVAVAALLGLGLTQLAGATGAVTIDTAPPDYRELDPPVA